MKPLCIALLVVLAGCQHATELLLVLSTDYADGQYDEVGIDVHEGGSDAATFSRTYLVPAEAKLPASLELHPSGGEPTVDIEVTLFDQGTALVTRRAILPFVEHRSLELRLELQQSCATVMSSCDPGDTCIDGACGTAQIDPATLPSISSSPLAPVDGSAGLDLPTPRDFASVTTDLGCPVVPPTPVIATDSPCTVTTFGANGTLPEDVKVPGDATVELVCGGRWQIHLPAGTHTYPSDLYIVPRTAAQAGNYTVTAGYWAATDGNAFVGVRAVDSNDDWFEFATTQTTGQGNSDRWIIFSDVDNNTPEAFIDQGDTNLVGEHTIAMARSVGDGSSSYAFNVSSASPAPVNESATLAPMQVPTFFVGNVIDSGHSNDITVQVAWVEVCPN